MSALRSTRRLVGLSTRVVSGSVHYMRKARGICLTRRLRFRRGVNKLRETEPETERAGEAREWTWAGLGGPTAVDRTERRTETGSSSKDYAGAEDDAVNKLAGKSAGWESLAPQVGLEPTTPRLTAECPLSY